MSFSRPVRHDVAVGTDVADVPGAEVAVGVEGLGRHLRVGVALADHGTLDADLAVDAGGGDGAVEGHDADVGGEDGLAHRVGQLFVGVAQRAHADHGDLGHAVAVGHLDADLAPDLVEDLGGHGRPAPGQAFQGGDDLLARLLALLVQVGLVEGGAPAGHGDPVAPKHADGQGGDERLEEDGREAEGEHHDQIVGAGDVGEGKGDRPDVVLRHVAGDGQAPAAGDQGRVGVAHPLRVGGGARRVVDPALVVARSRSRGRGQDRRGRPRGARRRRRRRWGAVRDLDRSSRPWPRSRRPSRRRARRRTTPRSGAGRRPPRARGRCG